MVGSLKSVTNTVSLLCYYYNSSGYYYCGTSIAEPT